MMRLEDMSWISEITVEAISIDADDDMVAHAARVSTGSQIDATEADGSSRDVGLIRSLMRNRHGTPFEHNSFTFYIHAPIFVFREFHRHRIGWSYNEESGRYKQLDPVFYVPGEGRELVQVPGSKQMLYELMPGSELQVDTMLKVIQTANHTAYEGYDYMLGIGIVKEVARMVLPVNIFSSMYATCNARSLMAFLSLRKKLNEEEAMFPSKPMKEINIVADAMEMHFALVMPITHDAFVEGKYVAP